MKSDCERCSEERWMEAFLIEMQERVGFGETLGACDWEKIGRERRHCRLRVGHEMVVVDIDRKWATRWKKGGFKE